VSAGCINDVGLHLLVVAVRGGQRLDTDQEMELRVERWVANGSDVHIKVGLFVGLSHHQPTSSLSTPQHSTQLSTFKLYTKQQPIMSDTGRLDLTDKVSHHLSLLMTSAF